jgi:hypothetical protein
MILLNACTRGDDVKDFAILFLNSCLRIC